MTDDKIALINDTHINLDEKDLLGTKIYADTLYNIIENYDEDTPITIGLFGSWGSGKSSIVKTLEDKILLSNEKHMNKSGVIIYDAWKYSEDAFRRSFILELMEKFKLNRTEELEVFYTDKHEEVNHSVGIDKSNMILSVVSGGILLILLSIIFIYSEWNVSSKIVMAIISTWLGLMVHFFSKSLHNYKISITKPKVFTPEQFENIFKEVIHMLTRHKNIKSKWIKQNICKDSSYNKIIIIIDNIDRCHSKLATELLLTIKNFLEIENCIFIVPVDNEALMKHFRVGNRDYKEEFLRKFFNVTVRIKDFTQNNLSEFTESISVEHNLGFSSVVADIISQEFSRNPRRIIQFLNNLSIERKVAEVQEKSGVLKEGAITSNIEFLAKIQLIREEWPKFYELISSNRYLLKAVDERLINNLLGEVSEYNEQQRSYLLDLEDLGKVELSENLVLFLKRTLIIQASDYDPFFRLRDYMEDVPDEIVNNILRQDIDQVMKYLDNEEITLERLCNIYDSELDFVLKNPDLFKTRGFSLLNQIMMILTNDEYLNYFNEYNLLFKKYFMNSYIVKLIKSFDRKSLMKYTKMSYLQDEKYLYNKVIKVVEESEDEKLLFDVIDEFRDIEIVLLKQKIKVGELLTKEVISVDQLDQVIDSQILASSLISNESVIYILNQIDFSISDRTKGLVNFLKKLNGYESIATSVKLSVLDKYSNAINTNNIESDIFWLNSMKGYFDKFSSEASSQRILNKINGSYDKYFPMFQRTPNNQNNIEISKAIIDMYTEYYLYTNPEVDNIVDRLINYFSFNHTEVFRLSLSSFKKIVDYFVAHNWRFSQNIINKFANVSEDDKITLIELILTMLEKTKVNRSGDNTGLDDAQIQQAINIIFNNYVTPLNVEIMRKVMVLRNVQKFTHNKILTLSDVNVLKSLIGIVEDPEVVENIVGKLLTINKTDYSALKNVIEEIKNLIPNDVVTIKKVILDSLNNFDKLNDRILLKVAALDIPEIDHREYKIILTNLQIMLKDDDESISLEGYDILHLIMQDRKRGKYKNVKDIVDEFENRDIE
jgi:hypothetical protein